MVNVKKGGGRAPPTLTSQANFTLMTECTPESRRYYSVYSMGQPNGAITGDDLSGTGRFRLVVRGISQAPESHLPRFVDAVR